MILAFVLASMMLTGRPTLEEQQGWYSSQHILTPALVKNAQFGKIFTTPVEGQIRAQPLVFKDTLLVATAKNWIYGLNPDSGHIKWSRQLHLPWNPQDLNCKELLPYVGITGTPIIDSEGIAYFLAKTYIEGQTGKAEYFVHAIDVRGGSEKKGFPLKLTGLKADNSESIFDPTTQLNRPGLIQMGKVIYAGFGGLGQFCTPPWKGWIIGFSSEGGEDAIQAVWSTMDTATDGGGIWQSGIPLLSPKEGQLLFIAGKRGTPHKPIPGNSPPPNLGCSLIKLQVQENRSLKATNFFTPYNAAELDKKDLDLGPAAPILLPKNRVLHASKEGYLYLHDLDNLGGCQQGPEGKDLVISRLGPFEPVFGRPVYWPGDEGYIWLVPNGPLRVFSYTDQTLSLIATGPSFGWGSSSPLLTSDGTLPGSALIWIVYTEDRKGKAGELRCYSANPTNHTVELLAKWPLDKVSSYTPPGVGEGKIYVGTQEAVIGFGPLR